MSVFAQMMDSQQHNKKNNLAGQISLFDLVSEEEKSDFEIRLPDVGEYSKELLLGFEKEVLGIYISGHPLEEYEQTWRKHITRTTADFMIDEETGEMNVRDQERVTVGGMIAEKKIKYTKNDKIMAFLTLEDLVGSIEVLVFPKVYEQESAKLTEENKVFVKGRVSAEEDKDGKIICESIQAFDDIRKTLWIKFPTMQEYETAEKQLMETLAESDGNDGVVIYVENPKAKKALPPNRNVRADKELLSRLEELYGEENIKVI
jgi:DNA polymerase-3 subunit alpha